MGPGTHIGCPVTACNSSSFTLIHLAPLLGMPLNCSPPCLGRQGLTETGLADLAAGQRELHRCLWLHLPSTAIIGHTSFQLSLWESSSQALRQALAPVFTRVHAYTHISKHDRLALPQLLFLSFGNTLSVLEKPISVIPSCLPFLPSPC